MPFQKALACGTAAAQPPGFAFPNETVAALGSAQIPALDNDCDYDYDYDYDYEYDYVYANVYDYDYDQKFEPSGRS